MNICRASNLILALQARYTEEEKTGKWGGDSQLMMNQFSLSHIRTHPCQTWMHNNKCVIEFIYCCAFMP